MSIDLSKIKPSGLEGIKRLAKRIKKDRNIKHSKALDVASVQAGFKDFRHARMVMGLDDEEQA